MRKIFPLILFLLASNSVFSQDPEEVRKFIDRQNSNATRWYANGDINSIVSVFTKDAWQMPPNSPPVVGREAIHRYWSEAFKWGKWQFTLEAQDVAVSGPIAIERGKYVLKFTAGSGAPPGMASFEDRGNYLVHWRLEEDGQWRVAADAPVSELPLQPKPNN